MRSLGHLRRPRTYGTPLEQDPPAPGKRYRHVSTAHGGVPAEGPKGSLPHRPNDRSREDGVNGGL
jgi:hypothetical protein